MDRLRDRAIPQPLADRQQGASRSRDIPLDGPLASRTQQLFEKLKDFPEAGRCEHGTHLKRDAYVAFFDLRQLLEREIIPALERAGV